MRKKPSVPDAQDDLNNMKMEVANELGINTSENMDSAYQKSVLAKNAGLMAGMKNSNNIGGEMVKRMITQAEKELLKREKIQKL